MATEIFRNSGEKIATAREKAGYNQTNFAKLIGIPNSTYNGYERGISPFPEKTREILKKKLNLTDADFLPDEIQTSEGRIKVAPDPVGRRRVPVVSWALAGTMEGRGHFEDLANQINETVETSSRDPNAFAIEISGDSMEPYVSPRDIVVFEPNHDATNGMPVLVKLIDGRVFFKRLYRNGVKITLQSDNDSYPDLEFDQNEIAFVYPARDIQKTATVKPRRASPVIVRQEVIPSLSSEKPRVADRESIPNRADKKP